MNIRETILMKGRRGFYNTIIETYLICNICYRYNVKIYKDWLEKSFLF